MKKENESTQQQEESTGTVKPKGKFAEFAMNSCGPVVINSETGLVSEAYRTNLRAIYILDFNDMLMLKIDGILMKQLFKK